MVGSARRIVVEFIGDASGLSKSVDTAGGSLSGFSSKAQAAGRVAGKVLAAGLLAAGAAAISATNAAAEDEAAQAQLAQQLRQAAGATDAQIASTEEWISAQSMATGVADDELRPALARLATATGDVGKAQDLMSLALDVSAGTGKSLETVTTALAKAQNGSISGLSRLGIATKNASGETMTLAEATQAMADKYNGAAAKAADTTAGKTRIMQVQFAELQEQIGAQLLPVMTRLAEIGLQVVGWISENTRTVGILVGALGALLAITWAVGVATKAAAAFQAIWTAATSAVTAAQWLLNAAMTANPIGIVVVAIGALVAALVIAYKNSETFRNIVNAAFGAVRDVVSAVVGWFGKYVPQVFGLVVSAVTAYVNAYRTVVVTVFNAVKDAVGAILGAVRNVVNGAWDAIVNVVRGSVNAYRSVVVNGMQAIREVLGNAVAAWKTLFNNAWDNIKDGFQNAKGALVTVAGNIRDAVSNAFDGIKGAIQGVINIVQSLIDRIGSLIAKIRSIPKPDIPGIPGLRTSSGGGGNSNATRLPDMDATALRAGAGIVGREGAGGGGGVDRAPVQVFIKLDTPDPSTAGDYIVKALRNAERRTGRKLLWAPA